MTENAPPSRNPTDDNSIVGMFALAFAKFLQQTDDMLPARVISYNRTTNRAQVQPIISVVTTRNQVQPIISVVTTRNQVVNRAVVASVPVLQMGGNGFLISFPLTAGSLGWIKANDRDISLFKKTLAMASPNTQRKHTFEDAMFIPDVMLQGVTIKPEDVNHAVFQNLDASVRLALWPHQLKITTPNMGISDIEGFTPNPHAVLDLQSVTRAFMPPRMTEGQRDAIPSPTEGMVVWNLDTHGLSVYNGSAWS